MIKISLAKADTNYAKTNCDYKAFDDISYFKNTNFHFSLKGNGLIIKKLSACFKFIMDYVNRKL